MRRQRQDRTPEVAAALAERTPLAPAVQTGRAQEAAGAPLRTVRFHTYSLLFLVTATLSLT